MGDTMWIKQGSLSGKKKTTTTTTTKKQK